MWVSEFQFDGSNAPIGSIAKKFNISISTYPVSLTEEKNRLLIYFACNIYGSEESKKLMFEYAKKNSRIHFIEQNDDFLIILFEEPSRQNHFINIILFIQNQYSFLLKVRKFGVLQVRIKKI